MSRHELLLKIESCGMADNENEVNWGAVQKEGMTDTIWDTIIPIPQENKSEVEWRL